MSDLPPTLPEGWAWTTIEEVRATSAHALAIGPFGSNLRVVDYRTSGVPLIFVRHIRSRDFAGLDPKFIDERKALDLSSHMVGPGDVVVTKMGEPPGDAAIYPGPAAAVLTADCIKLTAHDSVEARYLARLIEAPEFRESVRGVTQGVAQKKVSLGRFRGLPLPLAPLAEQERIVAAIEEHLSRLDAAAASLERCAALSEVLRQRVIDESLEGPTARLGEHLREPLRNGLSAPASTTGSVRVVTLTAVTRAEFTDEHTKLIERRSRSIDDLWMRPGDLFIQRSNTPELVGTAAMYHGPEPWAIFPDLLIRARPDDRLDPSYLELALRSTRVRRYFQGAAQGIAGSMPKISQPIIEAATIPVPDRTRQEAIVREASLRFEAVDGLERDVALARTRLTTLRRSILAAAFSGQLVPQDPDDEPAPVLLERIANERAAAAPSKRRRQTPSS